jgi:imidazolonepropionase-like amidohydrolase
VSRVKMLAQLLMMSLVVPAGVAFGQGAIVYEGARLIVGDGRSPIENAAFVIQNGRFTTVGRAGEIQVPAGATRVDLRDKTVMPTLVDAHGHISSLDQLYRNAYYGVGAVLSLGNSLELRNKLRAQPVPGLTRLYSASTRLEGRNTTTVEEARQRVAEQAAQDVDIIKIGVDDRAGTDQYQPVLRQELINVIAEEAKRHGLRVAAHIYSLDHALMVARSPVQGFAHNVRDVDVTDEFIELIKAKGDDFFFIAAMPLSGDYVDRAWLAETRTPEQVQELFNVPPRVAVRCCLGDEGTRNPLAVRRRPEFQDWFAQYARNLITIHELGVRMGVGSDEGDGWIAHTQMSDMWLAGMPAMDVIVAATKNGAEIIGTDDYGTIEVGKAADFIVLGANPLEDMRNTRKIEQVFIGGHKVDRDAIRATLSRGASFSTDRAP